VALLALIILSPLIGATGMLLLVANGGNVFFTQVRPGKNEKPFRLIKFKTMTDTKDANDEWLADEQRLTTLGKWVRKLSLDELPQLFNILKGDMSFIGPRPLLTEYLPLYNEFQKRRHEVKPGITGWAQVNGRNTLGWKSRFEHDIWYVDHQSFGLDMKIIFKTMLKVIKVEGISSPTSVTMEKFKGNA
jgi:lipopolysaccharide/colanic/teichoic acid biosynthesis glycosyltransferase